MIGLILALIFIVVAVVLGLRGRILGKKLSQGSGSPTTGASATIARLGSGVLLLLAVVALVLSSLTTVGASHIGIVTTFGRIAPQTLNPGISMVKPWDRVTQVYLGQQTTEVNNSDASSYDLQSVHASLVVNFSVTDGHKLFALNPTLTYGELLVAPAIQEVFKSVVAHYTAEQLVTKRQEVSENIASALSKRLQPYGLSVQNVNLTNFGFSKAFDEAIEQKVTASQQAETAKRNLERIQYEAQASVERAQGEAKAITIQADAIKNNGGDAYLRLKAIDKWDGKLPTYLGSGAVPFISVSDGK